MTEAGAEGNARLTATTGAVLLVLLAVEGVTILFLGPLLPEHIFVGMLLIPPVLLKLASTGWRFVRYYAGSRAYVAKGPPHSFMRMLAPLVVAATASVFVTGVALLLLGPQSGRGLVLGLHKVSFIVWIAVTGVHVLVYAVRLPRLIAADSWRGERGGGSLLRRSAIAATLVAGVTLAAATYPLAGPWLHAR
ncbi:MAG: hypothetical protein ACR2MU_00560 [Gaiellaceae bacterium]